MPYIKQEERGNMAQLLRPPRTTGQLNYLLTSICLAYMRSFNAEAGIPEDSVSYTAINNVVGALESCKLEFYRRQAAPYEDDKVLDNGDIPWLRS